MIKVTLYTLILLNSFHTCTQNESSLYNKNHKPVSVNDDNIHRAYFASGCFWCVEAIYESLLGVKEVISGYSGGETENPTYKSVSSGKTGHAETIEVIYNPKVISFSNLLDVYFTSQNIEQMNGQGPDMGSEYRSIIFFQNLEQKHEIMNKIRELELKNGVKVAAEVYPFQKFWVAEDYHQDFKKNNPNHPYILNVSNPRFKNFKFNYNQLINDN